MKNLKKPGEKILGYVLLSVSLLCFSSAAQSESMQMDHGDMSMQGGSAPDDARDPNGYSGGYGIDGGPYSLSPKRQLKLADEHHFWTVLFDRLEYVRTDDEEGMTYDGQTWFGGSFDRLVLKAEGEAANGKLQAAQTELMWAHGVSTFWNTQLGVRYDSGEGPDRSWLAFGFQGLTPYWFEVDATAYVGEDGRTAFDVEAEYDLLLTQKLILQPRGELSVFGKVDEALGIGRGVSNMSLGLRLRYEYTRQLAPYLGVEREQKLGDTADLARAANEPSAETLWVAGVRFWF